MTSTPTQPGGDSLTRLSDVLNKLAGRSLTMGETEEERKKLAAMSLNFNGASVPAAEKIAETLPGMTDYGSRWIASRMLRDLGLKDETQGDFALTTLCATLSAEKDPGSRYMLCNLVRDLGLAHEGLAVTAAAAIAGTVGREKDSEALMSEKGSLMALGLKYEAAGAIAVAGLSKALQENTEPYSRILLSSDLRDIGLKYPSQARAVITSVCKATQNETDTWTTQHVAQHLTSVALKNPSVAPQAMTAFSAGVARATRIESIFAWSNALNTLGKSHPMAAIVAMEQGFDDPAITAHKDKRRAYICNLSALADIGHPEAEACSKVLLKNLKKEPDAHQRRLIIKGLVTCINNRIDSRDVKDGLRKQLSREKDRETRETLERALRSLGYIKPVSNLVPFRPLMA